MISGIVMQDLDQSDENLARLSAMRALEMSPDGVPQSWRNPNTDKYGQSVVTQTMTTNRNCRMLSSVAYDAFGFKLGDEKVNYCRDANGKWVPVK
jgi:surface antigen